MARKKNYGKFVIILLFVAVVLFGSQQMGLLQIAGGIAPLSLGTATFQSSNEFFNQPLWVMTVTQGGIGAQAQGIIDNSAVGQQSGKTPAADLNIQITYSKQSCEYPIRVSNNQNVQLTNIREWSCLLQPSMQDAINNGCNSASLYIGKGTGSFTCFCVEGSQQTGAVAYQSIDNPNIHTVSTMSVTANNKVSTGTVDTQGNIAQFLGSNVYVQWNGDLLKQSCPSQASWYGFYRYGAWKLGQSSTYDDYKTHVAIVDAQIGKGATIEQVRNWVNTWNTRANSAMSEINIPSTSLLNSAVMNNAKVNVDLSSAVGNPVYTFFIKADWVGFLVPQPKPIIVSASGTTIKAGASGDISASVRNDGDSGNIDVTTTCNSPLRVSQVYNTQTFSIANGATQVVRATINCDTDRPQTGTCQICALANPRLPAPSCSNVQVSCQQQIVCTANTYSCVGRQIEKCNEFGSGKTVIDICPQNEVCAIEGGIGVCKSGGGSVCSLDSDCPSGYKCTADFFGRRSCQAIEPLPHCGNGYCEQALGETASNCPSDCSSGQSGLGFDEQTILIILAIVAGALAVGAVLRVRKKK